MRTEPYAEDPTTRAMSADLNAVAKALQTGQPLADVEDEMDWQENQGLTEPASSSMVITKDGHIKKGKEPQS